MRNIMNSKNCVRAGSIIVMLALGLLILLFMGNSEVTAAPPTGVTSVDVENSTFSPNGDTVKDNCTINVTADTGQTLYVNIYNTTTWNLEYVGLPLTEIGSTGYYIGSWNGTNSTTWIIGNDQQYTINVTTSNDGDPSNEETTTTGVAYIDTVAPTVTISVSDILISDSDAAGTFWVNCSFNEMMNDTTIPTISFNPDIVASGTLSFVTGVWNANDDWYNVSYTIADVGEEQLDIDVSVSGARDQGGNLQSPDPATVVDALDVDTLNPTVSVTVTQESAQAGIGEWINITVITDTDVVSVDADLATAGFTGQVDDQLFIDLGSGNWYYNFTVSAGTFDGTNTINVDATDDAGNTGINNTESATWDEIAPTVTVTIIQESAQIGIGEWINITVTTDADVVAVNADLATAGFTGQVDDQALAWSGTEWYYNFTVSAGTFDGTSTINVDATDDADNSGNNNTESATWDEIAPTITVTIIQESAQAGIGEWINITVTTDADVVAVNADLATAGFTGQVDDQALAWSGTEWYYNFTVSAGTFDGTSTINVDATDDAGNSGNNNTESATWDEIAPTITVTIIQESAQAGIGEWINITVTTDVDVMSVDADLATAGFTGQVDDQLFIDSGGGNWYYNFTVALGTFDGTSTINVDATDDAGNSGNNNTESATWDEIAPTVTVSIIQESAQAGIGEWVNITVTTDVDAVNVVGDLSAFAGQTASENFLWSGIDWYYNFTVAVGTMDGIGAINVTVTDDAGNSNYNDTETADVDEDAPTVAATVTQESTPAGIGEWINITVTTDADVVVVDVDLATAGFTGQADDQVMIWSGTDWYYNFTISAGIFEGTNMINIDAMDDAGNTGNNNTEGVTWDDMAPIIVVTITQESAQVGIGEWINITVITDADVVAVDADLATAGFTGQIDDQALIWSGTDWYYNFTVVTGAFDGSNMINIDAVDDVGNLDNNNTESATWDEVAPTVGVTIIQESVPAGVSDWINITVTTDTDVVSVDVDLATAGFTGQSDDQLLIDLGGGNWYYNFTITSGTFDGSNTTNVDAIDDAGNTGYNNTEVAYWVEIGPAVAVTITQGSIPAGIGEWINISVIADIDVVSVDVDLATAGFTGQSDDLLLIDLGGGNWYYNFTIVAGSFDGTNTINVDAEDNAGNPGNNQTESATWDEVAPIVGVTIIQESVPAGVGEWINITVTTDTDVVSVDVDLATAGFTGQSDDQLLIDLGGGNWYYNFTIAAGTFDGSNTTNVDAIDDAGNTGYNNTEVAYWVEIGPAVAVTITQGSIPAGIGEWINISVITETDVISVDADLATAGFTGQSDDQLLIDLGGGNWYYNFTIVAGTFDGTNTINVDAEDNAGNPGKNNTESATWDEVAPTVSVMVMQESAQAGIGEWINITVTTDVDVVSVDADLATAGFTGQSDDQLLIDLGGGNWYYNFTIATGTFDGTGTINVDVVDDAGHTGNNNTESATWDEVAPTVAVMVIQESAQAGISEWINITVTTDVDAFNVIGDLSAFTGQTASENFLWSGIDWYYNFTVAAGTLDGIGAINVTVTDDAGNSNYNDTETANVDEEVPTPTVIIIQESTSAGIGEWINITATIQGDDAVSVDVDLGVFTGQVDDIAMIYISAISTWYYNFTVVEGSLDSSSIIINVDATDDTGNTAFDNSQTANADEEAPTVAVTITQESIPAGIGEWINITVATDLDTVSVDVDLATAGFTGQNDNRLLIDLGGGNWYYNFTIAAGTYDGSNTTNVDAIDDAGNTGYNDTEVAYWVEIGPAIAVTITQGSTPAGIGEWINISVITDTDTISIDVDLATAGFTGQSDDQLLIDLGGGNWYYNFTIVTGTFDGTNTINVDAEDNAGNSGKNNTESATWDEVAPTVAVTIKQESAQAGIDEWINITVTTDMDVVSVDADLATAGFTGEADDQAFMWSGTDWYYNFTVSAGTFDGSASINVDVMDDADNMGNNNTETATWDEVAPMVAVTVTQESAQVGVGEWINITVTTDADVVSVDADLATAGFTGEADDQALMWSGTDWYYNLTVVAGTFDGTGSINVDVMDDADNMGNNNTELATWDEVAPTVDVTITQESAQPSIGEWINITVTTDSDIISVVGNLSDFSGLTASESFLGSGSNWYCNFTVMAGTLEGLGAINVTVTDDGGNIGYNNTETTEVDEVIPDVTITSTADTVDESYVLNATIIGANTIDVWYKIDSLDAELLPNIGGDDYEVTIDTSGLSEDDHTIQIIAYDLSGNVNNTEFIVITVDHAAPVPPTVDFIVIQDGPNGTAYVIPNIHTGEQLVAYASGYNSTTLTFVGLVEVTWTDDPDLGEFENDTGNTTTFTAGSTGGLTTITAENTTLGISDDFTINIGEWGIDYIRITDSADGTEIQNKNVPVGISILGVASGYNDTIGYVNVLDVDWSVVNANGAQATTSDGAGSTETLSAGTSAGTATWTIEYDSLTDSVVFTITSPTVDYIWIVDEDENPVSVVDLKAGETMTIYAVGFNYSSGRIGPVEVDWSVSEGASVSPAHGTSTTIKAGDKGGNFSVTADYGGGVTISIPVAVKEKEPEGFSMLFIIIPIIIIVVLVLLFLLMRRRKEEEPVEAVEAVEKEEEMEEAPAFEEEEELGWGEEGEEVEEEVLEIGEGEAVEFECPDCGALLTPDLAECPGCGLEFEVIEEDEEEEEEEEE